jgi:hypothetical protein
MHVVPSQRDPEFLVTTLYVLLQEAIQGGDGADRMAAQFVSGVGFSVPCWGRRRPGPGGGDPPPRLRLQAVNRPYAAAVIR